MDSPLIRPAAESDCGDILAIYAPYVENTSVTFEVDVPRPEDFLARMRKIKSRYPYLVAVAEGRTVGYAYAVELMERAAYQWNAALSVYLRADFAGRGLGTALYQALMELLKLQNFQNVYGVVTLPNPASVKLHQRLGFRPVGQYEKAGYKCGAWHEVMFFEKHIGDHGFRPEPPIFINEIDENAIAGILTGAALKCRAEHNYS